MKNAKLLPRIFRPHRQQPFSTRVSPSLSVAERPQIAVEPKEEVKVPTATHKISNSPNSPLMDSFGRFHNYLRISLTEKCNLRCHYCMPEEGVPLCPPAHLLTAEEIGRLVKLFADQGVDKVRLTGGEPTIRKDLLQIVRSIGSCESIRQLGITTNGIILNRLLPDLVDAGLTHLNISLDTLCPGKYAQITRRNAFDKVWRAIGLAERLMPRGRVKLNCVLIRGQNDAELGPMVELTRERALDMRFIEFMPFAGNRFDMHKFMPYQEMLARLGAYFGETEIQRLQDAPNDTSKAYKVRGFVGQFGFITSMSEHFCGTCNRMRITADGNLKVCLHGHAEISLRDPLRAGLNDAEMLELIGKAVRRKAARHAGLDRLIRLADSVDGRPMVRIGG